MTISDHDHGGDGGHQPKSVAVELGLQGLAFRARPVFGDRDDFLAGLADVSFAQGVAAFVGLIGIGGHQRRVVIECAQQRLNPLRLLEILEQGAVFFQQLARLRYIGAVFVEIGALVIEEIVFLEPADFERETKKLTDAFPRHDLRFQQPHVDQREHRQADDQCCHGAVAENDLAA